MLTRQAEAIEDDAIWRIATTFQAGETVRCHATQPKYASRTSARFLSSSGVPAATTRPFDST